MTTENIITYQDVGILKYMYLGWCVYMIEGVRSAEKSLGKKILYTGSTNNLHRRFVKEHLRHIKSGYMSRNKIMPRGIVYLESVNSQFDARKRERQIKRMPKAEKLKLIEDFWNKEKEKVPLGETPPKEKEENNFKKGD